MPKSIGDAIPPPIQLRFDGRAVSSRIGITAMLVTAAEDGWPSIALLSVGEVLIADPVTVRLALWPGSRSTSNLERNAHGSLAVFGPDEAIIIRLLATRGADLSVDGRPLAFFEAHVVEVLSDAVPYARITQGIAFDLVDRAATLRHWTATIEALLAAARPTRPPK